MLSLSLSLSLGYMKHWTLNNHIIYIFYFKIGVLTTNALILQFLFLKRLLTSKFYIKEEIPAIISLVMHLSL